MIIRFNVILQIILPIISILAGYYWVKALKEKPVNKLKSTVLLIIDIIAVWSFGLLLEYLSVEDMRGLSILEEDFIQSAAKQSLFFEILGLLTLTVPVVIYHIKKLRKRTVKE